MQEHALAHKIAQSPQVEEVLCAPGNGGTDGFCRNLPIPVGDLDRLVATALQEKVGLVVIGAALGIGKLAVAALDGMARQPEVAGNIQTAMIIAAALIEGFTFFALYICMS